ncbi:hypothetical protein NQ314_014329 [Rhamnusium bicolor]|uniref:Uncharacterized protein n=1 Tax=Rhamnusium bicolor TaxID=1586634 RepID=A0AAV8X209_9CUCU|nr:hypothetical protein NQ314_014329 [Rhamnusium bicolor]
MSWIAEEADRIVSDPVTSSIYYILHPVSELYIITFEHEQSLRFLPSGETYLKIPILIMIPVKI